MKRSRNPFPPSNKLRRPQFFTTLILIAILLFYSGCSTFNCTRLEKVLGGRTNLIDFSYKIAENLVDRSLPPLVPRHPDMPILVTTLVDNNDLKQTSPFGRTLQEHISSRLAQLGYTVREIKLADTLRIEPNSGETMLSRDLTKLSSGHQAQAILVGTISRSNRILYISARLINPENHNIIASDDYQLCMDEEILAMFGLQYQDDVDKAIDKPDPPLLNSIL
jgi:TolB-like protein